MKLKSFLVKKYFGKKETLENNQISKFYYLNFDKMFSLNNLVHKISKNVDKN